MSGLALRLRGDEGNADYAGANALLSAISIRGTDRLVAVTRGNVEIAHAAFDVTPESVDEHFPVCHPDLDMWVIADARLDYREELAEALQNEGCSFTPNTDAEFILAAHEVWGETAQTHLVGDFAYVVCDDGSLIAARDVLGGKPLWWALCGQDLVIASTIRCVVEQCPKPLELNETFIADFLSNYVGSNTATVYEGISRLGPGQRLRVRSGHPPEVDTVDELYVGKPVDVGFDEAARLVRSALTAAVRERMRSLTPVSSELSGGLDSSTIVGLVAELAPAADVVTLSNVYPGEECDESPYIEAVAEAVDATQNHLRPLESEPLDLRMVSAETRDIVAYPDLLPQLWSLAADSGIRVVLTGQGGDHAFDHPSYFECDLVTVYGVIGGVRRLLNSRSPKSKWAMLRTLALSKLAHRSEAMSSGVRTARHLRRLRRLVFMTEPMRRIVTTRSTLAPDRRSEQDWNQLIRQHGYVSPNNIWAYEHMERSSAAIVDVRHPFFDRKFVELILSLPTDVLYPSGEGRVLHRCAFGDLLPQLVRERTTKAEFSLLYQASHAVNAPGGFADMSTHDIGWTNPNPLTQWAEEFGRTGRTDHLYSMWHPLVVSRWLDALDERDVDGVVGSLARSD